MKEKLRQIFNKDDRDKTELDRLFDLMALFHKLGPPPDSFSLYTNYEELKKKFKLSIATEDADQIETSFLELYCHVHGVEAPYTEKERKRMDEAGGYWCHAGGVSPIVKAGEFIKEESISCDYGAGNGLQGLLFQKLYPHKRCVQIELSSKMVESGKELQTWLGIEKDRVEWVVDDVVNVSPKDIDFIYLYRPVKPVGEGVKFYEMFSKELGGSKKEHVIFSIADCLRDYLPPGFKTQYSDGHLTIYSNTTV